MVAKVLAVCISFYNSADCNIVCKSFEDIPKFIQEYFDQYEVDDIKGYVIDRIDLFVDGKEDV